MRPGAIASSLAPAPGLSTLWAVELSIPDDQEGGGEICWSDSENFTCEQGTAPLADALVERVGSGQLRLSTPVGRTESLAGGGLRVWPIRGEPLGARRGRPKGRAGRAAALPLASPTAGYDGRCLSAIAPMSLLLGALSLLARRECSPVRVPAHLKTSRGEDI